MTGVFLLLSMWITGAILFYNSLFYLHGRIPIQGNKTDSAFLMLFLLIIFLILLNLVINYDGTTK